MPGLSRSNQGVTASGSSVRCHVIADAKDFGCPVEVSLEFLSGKWKPVILGRLKERPRGYGELRRLIPSLSDKVLTERLRDLEARGLIARDSGSASPRRTYRLTDRGESLRPVLQALYDWGLNAAADLRLEMRPEVSEPGADAKTSTAN